MLTTYLVQFGRYHVAFKTKEEAEIWVAILDCVGADSRKIRTCRIYDDAQQCVIDFVDIAKEYMGKS